MYQGVFLQRVLLGEGGAALRALERVRVRVCCQVGRHLPCNDEGALIEIGYCNLSMSLLSGKRERVRRADCPMIE